MVRTMLQFPNRDRSYDQTRRAVRFWGHEDVLEYQFTITEEALMRISRSIPLDEADFLRVFDANVDLIKTTAVRVYGRGRKGSYHLVAGDF